MKNKGPYIHSNQSTSKMMFHLTVALLPLVFFSFYKNGIIPYLNHSTNLYGMLRPLLFIFVAVISTFLIETIYQMIFFKKKDQELIQTIKNSYAYIPGLFLGLILPINTTFPILIIACFIAIIIGKMIYGGFGNNVFNPALIGLLFITTMYGSVISTHGGYLNSYENLIISSATPLTNQSLIDGIGNYHTLVEPFGNLWDFFIGTIPGAIGETSALLCIIGFIYLTYHKVIKWKIPLFYIMTVFIMTFIIGSCHGLGIWYPTFQILSGGLLFGAIFMATDPVTSPTTSLGQVIGGITLGILTVLFRYMTASPEGVMTSILTFNLLTFTLDKIGLKQNKKIIIIILICMIAISFGISKSIDSKQNDNNFHLIDKKIENTQTIYTVTQKGNGGNIKIEITKKEKKPIQYKVLEHNETPAYYQKIEEENYIEKLLNSENVETVDTVSGATISSTALKKALLAVIELEG